VSLHEHPEFEDGYTIARAEMRRGKIPDAVVDAPIHSMSIKSDSAAMADYLAISQKRLATR
jgi:hypothetical protein